MRTILLLTLLLFSNGVITVYGQGQAYGWLEGYREADTVARRIDVPAGYERVAVGAGSFEAWLRHLPLKPGSPPVYLYNGQLKGNQQAHWAVIDIDTGARDLQQCADAVIRLRAEYLYGQSQFDAIAFNFTSGARSEYRRWRDGYRPVIRGNAVTWARRAGADGSRRAFREYLDNLFTYAGTFSLSRQLRAAAADTLKIGDLFIQGGFPGHAVIVVDMAVDKRTGKKVFLLAQSYMPAQQIHILKNPNNRSLSPWYEITPHAPLVTPEWTFNWQDLRRF